MNRIIIPVRSRRSKWLEWAIVLPIVAAAIFYILWSAPDAMDDGETIVRPTHVDQPNTCPEGYGKGEFIDAGQSYTCRRSR